MHPIAISIVAFAFFILALLLLGVAIRVRVVEGRLARVLEMMRSDELRDKSGEDDSDDSDDRSINDDLKELERAGVTVKRWNESMRR